MAAAELAPESWADHSRPARLAAPTDASIYELHVRDFSVSDSTVPEHLRGKYLAFAEADTAGARLSPGCIPSPWPLGHPCCKIRTLDDALHANLHQGVLRHSACRPLLENLTLPVDS